MIDAAGFELPENEQELSVLLLSHDNYKRELLLHLKTCSKWEGKDLCVGTIISWLETQTFFDVEYELNQKHVKVSILKEKGKTNRKYSAVIKRCHVNWYYRLCSLATVFITEEYTNV